MSPDVTTDEHAAEESLASDKKDTERRGRWTWRNAQQVQNPRSPKIEEAARIGIQARNCAVIYFCENVAVHFWLKQELIRGGVPAERIAVLNAETAPTPQHRQTIAEKFNGIPPVLDAAGRIEQEGTPPEFDHVIANSVAYEGIDLQVRTCQVIHLDLPWEPATLQQRNGRAVRQGNLQSVIRIVYLLSEGSVDVIRLQMITGKLGWMRDLLQSADRETNNPAAQSELSVEEMLLYLSGGDAENALAELGRQQDEERRKNVLKNAWTTLQSLVSRIVALARLKDGDEQARTHAAIEEAKRRLLQTPSDIWPWAFLIPIAESGTPLLVIHTQDNRQVPIWEGARHPDATGGMEVGKVEGDVFGVRRFGSHAFQPLDAGSADFKRTFAQVAPLLERPDPMAYRRPWPEAEDRAALAAGLHLALAGVARGDFEGLGLRWANESHRAWFWQHAGLEYLTALSRAPASDSILIPIYERDALKLLPAGPALQRLATQAALSSVLAPTRAGWKNFLQRAASSQGLKWGDLNLCADAWWGRSFPRGILPKSSESDDAARWVTVPTSEGPEKVLALWTSRYFVLHRPLGEDETSGAYSVTHLPSGLHVKRVRSVDAGQAVIRYLEAQPVRWQEREIHLDPALKTKIAEAITLLAESEAPQPVLSRLLTPES